MSVLQLRDTDLKFRAYALYVPGKLILPTRFAAEVSKYKAAMRKAGLESHFAESELTTAPRNEWWGDERCIAAVKQDFLALRTHQFSTVCIFGSGMTDYTRHVVRVSFRWHIPINNFAEENSVLDRFLQNWFGIKNRQAPIA